MKILICDDDQLLSDEIAHNIEEAIGEQSSQLVGPKLTKELTNFFAAMRQCMSFELPEECAALPESAFDVDMVILDNNLTLLDVTGAPLTAESIAGYLRAFTRAGYIISLNLNSEVDFDLRYLVGDYSTRADLALNTPHLANRALWTGSAADSKDGFRPWYWPKLNTVVDRRRQQIEFIRDNLNESVLASLGFDAVRTSFLSAHSLGGLSSKVLANAGYDDIVSPEKITYRDVFVDRDRSLPVRDEREKLAKATDNDVVKEVIARTVAADIDFWFRRDVVGPQEPLVDVPHLLSRLPFLLGKRARNLDGWNRSLNAHQPPFGIEQKLYNAHLAPTKYAYDLWVPNACFWWHELKNDPTLDELFVLAEEGEWADVVFCEDKSSFVSRESQNGESPKEFAAEFESAWGRRYVAYIDRYQYAPRSRLAV